MYVEPHHTSDQLAALIRSEPRAKVARRLTAVRLALLGRTAPAISPRSCCPTDRSAPGWPATTVAASRP
jgi:hypothetical protein